MQYKLPLPCTALELESFVHRHCDAQGFTNCEVSTDGSNLILHYPDWGKPEYAPGIPGSSKADIPQLRGQSSGEPGIRF